MFRARAARLLGCEEHWERRKRLADWAIEAIERFIGALGLNRTLSDYGVPEADIESIAAEVCANFGANRRRSCSDRRRLPCPNPPSVGHVRSLVRTRLAARGPGCLASV